MKLGRCPVCHSHLHLDSIVQDSSAKPLLAAVAKLPSRIATQVVGYVSLFRPMKSDLNNERALRLINEVLDLTENQRALCVALEQTTSTIMAKRIDGTAQPLKNHSYLIKVLNTTLPQFKPSMGKTAKEDNSTVELKHQGLHESAEENEAKFQEQMNRWQGGK